MKKSTGSHIVASVLWLECCPLPKDTERDLSGGALNETPLIQIQRL
jgi:hypothetical protein